jgi:hypothetical protein
VHAPKKIKQTKIAAQGFFMLLPFEIIKYNYA